jgi:hypothetical protein
MNLHIAFSDGESRDINGVNLLIQLSFLEIQTRRNKYCTSSPFVWYIIRRLLSKRREHPVLFHNFQGSQVFPILKWWATYELLGLWLKRGGLTFLSIEKEMATNMDCCGLILELAAMNCRDGKIIFKIQIHKYFIKHNTKLITCKSGDGQHEN